MIKKILLGLILLFLLPFVSAWTDTAGGDHGGTDWTPANLSNLSGIHTNIGTFSIPAGIIIYVDGYQRTSDGGNLTISATTVSIIGTLDASGRGFGGGGGGQNGDSNCSSNTNFSGGFGGINGNGGRGSYDAWGGCVNPLFAGGGGGGGPNGAYGFGNVSQNGSNGTAGTFTLGGQGGKSMSTTLKAGGPGGIGYGGGGGGGAGWSAGGGGGGGGGSGGFNASWYAGGRGAGSYSGLGGAGSTGSTQTDGSNGGYLGANSTNDSTTNTIVYLGSGGGGGGSSSSGSYGGGGGGGGAGGGVIVLNATSISISGTLYTYGSAGGTSGSGTSTTLGGMGEGGGGAGGGIAILGCDVNVTGTFDLRGKQLNVSSTANGGTLKIFYTTLTNSSNVSAGRIYTNDNISIARGCGMIFTLTYPINNQIYNLNVNHLNYTSNNLSAFDSCWWSNNLGISNSSRYTPGNNFTGLSSSEGNNTWTIYCNYTNYTLLSKNTSFTIDTILPQFSNIANQTLAYKTTLAYQINASDASGISCFSVNDTTNFNINCSGYLQNKTFLDTGLYWINISINDTANNLNSALIFVNMTPPASINVTIISPTTDVNVTQGNFFRVKARISCSMADCGDINVSLDPNPNTVYNFTTCGASGRTGPNQTQCDTNYTGTTLQGLVNVTNGIQNFTVPATGTYTIEVAGARGSNTTTAGAIGGNGSKMIGTFSLTQGTVLQILVGQMGPAHTYGGAGGGGSFVANGSSYANATPMIVAGGGGGGSSDATAYSQGISAVTTINGTDGSYTSAMNNKGINGNGGGKGTASSYAGAGGGGFYGNGTAGHYVNSGGKAFANGGSGGTKGSSGAEGGFGGGGANGYWGSGGGGGYSGGGGGYYDGYGGGGGGSYNNGTNQNNTAGINNKNGYVVITYTGGSKGGDISTTAGTTPFYTNSSNPQTINLNNSQNQIVSWDINATGTINTTYTFFVYANKTSDLSINNLSSTFNVTIVNASNESYTGGSDETAPSISILFPSNNSIFKATISSINYSVSDDIATDSCWYSLDSGILNSSIFAAGTNFTSLSSSEGNNTWTIYCNDSSNNIATRASKFTIDTVPPEFSSIENQSIEYADDLSYQVNATDNVAVSCFSENSALFQINCSGFLQNSALLPVSIYTLNITVNDTAGNLNSILLLINVTNTNPLYVILNNPYQSYSNTTETTFNLTFNCSAADDTGVANISLYLSNNNSRSFSLNQTINVSGVSNESVWTLQLSTGNYLWNCLASDIAGATDWGSINRSINIIFADSDSDGVVDSRDKLNGTSSSINKTGISDLIINVGNETSLTTFNDTQEIIFYDSSTPLINFSFNFSQNSLDLNKITIIKDSNYLIVNLSNQLQEDYNKTLYLKDNNFVSLCVKDAQISSISEVSSACNGNNETDFTECLGNNTGVTNNTLLCIEENDTIRISNLRYSAIKGVPYVAPQQQNPSGGSSSGGGAPKPECKKDSDCKETYACYQSKCVKLFDAEILEIVPILDAHNFSVKYFIKGMANIKGDVIISFWIEDNGKRIILGQDTIYLGSFEEKTKTSMLNLPVNLVNGTYDFYMQVGFENYNASSFRKINIAFPEKVLQASPIEKIFTYNFAAGSLLGIIIAIAIIVIIIIIIRITRFERKLTLPIGSLKYKLRIFFILLQILLKDGFRQLIPILSHTKSKIFGEKELMQFQTLTSSIGKLVYSSSGDKIGIIKEAYVQDNKVYGWIVKLEEKYNIKRRIMIHPRNVISISNMFIIEDKIDDFLNNLKS